MTKQLLLCNHMPVLYSNIIARLLGILPSHQQHDCSCCHCTCLCHRRKGTTYTHNYTKSSLPPSDKYPDPNLTPNPGIPFVPSSTAMLDIRQATQDWPSYQRCNDRDEWSEVVQRSRLFWWSQLTTAGGWRCRKPRDNIYSGVSKI